MAARRLSIKFIRHERKQTSILNIHSSSVATLSEQTFRPKNLRA
jgi:hypothetical protein